MTALRHFLTAVQFFTRIPITGALARWVGYSPELLRASSRHFPGVGWLIGLLAAMVLYGSLLIPPPDTAALLLAAALSTAASVWLTGAFHEDGLADTADGLGGGLTRERALHIMKDSRIGTYGAISLMLALFMKITLLALIAGHSTSAALAALICAHVWSRFAPLVIMWRLPYVGNADLSKSKPLADATSAVELLVGAVWALAALLLGYLVLGTRATIIPLLLGTLALAYMARLLRRRLQGFTGDSLGAVQQVCELACYLGVAWSWAA